VAFSSSQGVMAWPRGSLTHELPELRAADALERLALVSMLMKRHDRVEIRWAKAGLLSAWCIQRWYWVFAVFGLIPASTHAATASLRNAFGCLPRISHASATAPFGGRWCGVCASSSWQPPLWSGI